MYVRGASELCRAQEDRDGLRKQLRDAEQRERAVLAALRQDLEAAKAEAEDSLRKVAQVRAELAAAQASAQDRIEAAEMRAAAAEADAVQSRSDVQHQVCARAGPQTWDGGGGRRPER